MRFFVLALLLVSCFAADSEFSFEGNLSRADVRFRYRSASMEKHDINLFDMASVWCADWTSASVGASSLNKSASADALAGAFIPGFNTFQIISSPPITVATYVSGRASIDFSTIEKLILGKVDASVSAGAIAFALPGILEVDKQGNVINKISFANSWALPEVVQNTDSRIKVVKAHFKDESKAVIDIYLVSSSVAGYLQFANTPVSPNTLEVIVSIKDYKYTVNSNHLELVIAGATVNAEGKGSFSTTVDYRKAGNTILSYVALKGNAFVDKKEVSVSISSFKDSENDLAIPSLVKGFITDMLAGSSASLVYRHVAFPPGATNITYDPAIGSGFNVYGASSRIVLSFAALVLALLLSFF